MISQDVCILDLKRKNIILKETEPISNILKVVNPSLEKTLNFRLIVSHPNNWKFLGNKSLIYSLTPLDSIFLPIRLVPSEKFSGNTKYFISCFIEDVDLDVSVNAASFFISKELMHSWKITSLPAKKLYLKNKENEINYEYTVLNNGTEYEEIIVDVYSQSKNKITFIDSTGRPLKNLKYLYSLSPGEDTTIKLNVILTERLRNYKTISNTKPYLNNKAQKYFINVKSKQSIYFETKKQVFATTEIKHLPNSIKENPFPKKSYPLSWVSQFSNLNSPQPLSNTSFYGRFYLKSGGNISFQNQFFLGGSGPLRLSNFLLNVTYNDRKLHLRSGSMGNGIISGQGISSSYKITNRATLGGNIIIAPNIFNWSGVGFGLNTYLRPFNKSILSLAYGFASLDSSRTTQNNISSSFSYTINSNHSFNIGGNILTYNTTRPNSPPRNVGLMVNGGYNIRYLKRFNTRIGASVLRPSTGAIGSAGIASTILNQGTSFNLNPKWSFFLTSDYNYMDSISDNQQEYRNFTNRFRILGEIFGRPFRPILTHRVFTYKGIVSMQQSIQYSFSNSNKNTNRLSSYSFQLGRRKTENRNAVFLYNFNYFTQYRVWRLLASYSKGGLTDFITSDAGGTAPSFTSRNTFLINISNQYQFLNPRWLLENSLSLRSNYLNSISINPRIFYFTKNGFNLMLQPGLYWSKQKNTTLIGQMNENFAPSAKYGIFVNFSIRKEIALSLPKSEKIHSSLKFIAFFDHNGNYELDEDENLIENVVVTIGNNELITNEKGEAELINAYKDSLYDLNVFSITDLRDYFPNYNKQVITFKDSTIFLPFVKGVSVFGEIYIDQDQTQKGFDNAFDLSNLRVSAFNGLDVHTLTDSKGRFEMYVPYGKYTISIQDRILGNKFKALENNFILDLDGSTERVFVSFYLVEKRKKITIKKF